MSRAAWKLLKWSQFRRQSTGVSHHNPSNSLDLDFVLSLLNPSTSKLANTTDNKEKQQQQPPPPTQTSSWTRMKFKVVETGEQSSLESHESSKED